MNFSLLGKIFRFSGSCRSRKAINNKRPATVLAGGAKRCRPTHRERSRGVFPDAALLFRQKLYVPKQPAPLKLALHVAAR